MRKQRKWWLVMGAVVVVLFISSSMTYGQQTLIPVLQRLLAGQPGRGLLSGIDFTYAGTRISIRHLGYFAFIEFFLRKSAHVAIYFLLGLAGSFGLQKRVTPTWLRVVLTVLACAGVAAFDEFHQLLTGGRSPLFQDVMLDTVAAAVAVGLGLLVTRRRS